MVFVIRKGGAMPAFLTHYACGLRAFEQMPDGQVRQAILQHPTVYGIGLAGPDLFFYSLWEIIRPGRQLGGIMHQFRTGMFLRSLYDETMLVSGEERRIALAYLAGFCGHYCLDASCHPFICRMTDDPSSAKALGRHYRLEAEIDARICREFLGRPIQEAGQVQMVRLSGRERTVVAHVLSRACSRTYPDAGTPTGAFRFRLILREYHALTAFLTDPSGFKEWLVYGVEKKAVGHPFASPLFINGNSYGLKDRDWMRFRRRFLRGGAFLERLLPLLEEAVCRPEMAPEFFRKLGSRSYLTGKSSDGSRMDKTW